MLDDKWSNLIFEKFQDCGSIRGGIYAKWDFVAKEARKDGAPKIIETIKKNNLDKDMMKLIEEDLKFHLISCLIIQNYKSDNSKIFEQILEVYLSGHIPCGYRGSRKAWKIIVH